MVTEKGLEHQTNKALAKKQAFWQASDLEEMAQKISQVMLWQDQQTLSSWCERLLQTLVPMLHGIQATLYYKESEQQFLTYGAGFAIDYEAKIAKEIAMGDGLIGNVAKTQELFLLNEPNHFVSIMAHQPKKAACLAIIPLVYNLQTCGVIEISFAQALPNHYLPFIEKLTNIIAINLNAIIIHHKLKESFEKLIQSQERFKRLAEVTTEAIAFVNEEDRIIEVNTAFLKMFNYSLEECVGKTIEYFLFIDNPEDKKNLHQKIRSYLPYETLGVRKNYSFFHVEIQAQEVEYKDQTFQIVSLRDITKRVVTEEKLQQSQEKLAEAEKIIQLTSEIQKQKEVIEKEKQKSDKLLLNILPHDVAQELKEKGVVTPKLYEKVTIIFTDFQGFTSISELLSPMELIQELDKVFLAFDEIIERNNLERIKTIGDAYMAVGGLIAQNNTHPLDAVKASLEIQEYMQYYKQTRIAEGKPFFECRLGINTGKVVAGVVGKRKFAFDIWGDAVNVASRVESTGVVNKVNISCYTYDCVKDFVECEHRGAIGIKNKGLINMYFVHRLLPLASAES